MKIVQEVGLKEILALNHKKITSGAQNMVYNDTLDYIAAQLPNVARYDFSDNDDLLKYVKENDFSMVISTNEIPLDTVLALKGQGLVHILIGMKDDLLDVSDIIIDPLLRKSEKYFVGTRYLLSQFVTDSGKDPDDVDIELASLLGIDVDTLIEEVSHNEAKTELLDIAQLCQKLEWDSGHFGINIGFISCLRLTPNIEKHIKKFIRKEKIDMLEYLCNCHDRESVLTSEKSGYSFVDMRFTFEQFLQNKKKIEGRENYSVCKGGDLDIEKLRKIATDIYKYSRYYFDENFDRDKVIRFYVDWAEKAIRGTFDDYAYVLHDYNEPIGFCTIKKTRKNAAKIGLFGMDSQYAGKGLAKHLLDTSLQKLREEEGVGYVEVVTQGRNYAAQRLYQKCGFITKSTELWYHKWFH